MNDIHSLRLVDCDGEYELNFDPFLLVRNGVCDEKNAWSVSCALASWTSNLQDSPIDSLKPRNVVRKFYRLVTSNPFQDTVRFYSGLSTLLLEHSTNTGVGTTTGPFIDDFKRTPIFREYLSWFKNEDQPLVFTYLISFTNHVKKLEYVDPSLVSNAFREWEETEEHISSHILPTALVERVRKVCEVLYDGNCDLPFFLGKHGSGAVATGENDAFDKCMHITFDAKVRKLFSHNSSLWRYVQRNERDLEYVGSIPAPDCSQVENHSSARIKDVPKTVFISRLICMEPPGYMWAQQGVMSILIKIIDNSLAGRFIRINDQTRNQRFAVYGSWSNNVDTTDLSRASDSVKTDLVRSIFPRALKYLLLSTRSSKVKLFDGTYRKVDKFAPMGSALCFPVQCMTFLAITLVSYIETFTQSESIYSDPDLIRSFIRAIQLDPSNGVGMESICVYGDDIICDSRVTPTLHDNLIALGFTVNKDKSFTASQSVRESCGVYAYKGYDVTPLRYKVKWFNSSLNPRAVSSMIDMINRYRERGYYRAASYLQNYLLYCNIEGVKKNGNGCNPILFSSEGAGFFIKAKNPTNGHLIKEFKNNYQCDSLRHLILVSKRKTYPPKYYVSETNYLGDEPSAYKRLSSNEFDSYMLRLEYRSHVTRGTSSDARDLEFQVPKSDPGRGARFGLRWSQVYKTRSGMTS
jgi:hypothetical protein